MSQITRTRPSGPDSYWAHPFECVRCGFILFGIGTPIDHEVVASQLQKSLDLQLDNHIHTPCTKCFPDGPWQFCQDRSIIVTPDATTMISRDTGEELSMQDSKRSYEYSCSENHHLWYTNYRQVHNGPWITADPQPPRHCCKECFPNGMWILGEKFQIEGHQTLPDYGKMSPVSVHEIFPGWESYQPLPCKSPSKAWFMSPRRNSENLPPWWWKDPKIYEPLASSTSSAHSSVQVSPRNSSHRISTQSNDFEDLRGWRKNWSWKFWKNSSYDRRPQSPLQQTPEGSTAPTFGRSPDEPASVPGLEIKVVESASETNSRTQALSARLDALSTLTTKVHDSVPVPDQSSPKRKDWQTYNEWAERGLEMDNEN
ncbi:hypothetical protein WAI453_003567 [Rhynchosporium graminicola]